jgi:hypothetical protein
MSLAIISNLPSTFSVESVILSIELFIFFKTILIVLDCTLEFSASFLISSATTANPFPASPAWAASIAAFIESRFVWLAMFSITEFISKRPSDSRAISCMSAATSCNPLRPTSEAAVKSSTFSPFFMRVWVTD